MPAPKLDSKILKRLDEVFGPHMAGLFNQLGSSVVAIVELTSVERAEPYAEEEKAPTAKLRITSLEIATKAQEDALRRAQQAMHLLRTGRGTLDDPVDHEHATRQLDLLSRRVAESED